MMIDERSSMCQNDILEKGPKKSKMTDQSRLASFFSYPYTSEVGAFVLAEAGFYYKGQNDAVICRHCGLKYSGWQKGDNPKCIHLKQSPKCSFFQTSKSETGVYGCSSEKGNILLSGANGGPEDIVSERKYDTEHHIKSKTYTTQISFQETKSTPKAVTEVQTEEKTCVSDQNVPDNAVHRDDRIRFKTIYDPYNENEAIEEQHEAEHFLRTEDSATTTAPIETQTVESRVDNTREDLSDSNHVSEGHSDTTVIETTTGPLETTRPKYEQFSVLATRLNSYRHWPKHLKQRPEVLAKAGLFYEGTNDFVRCFHCAGGLREWDPEDDPFYEHARWFPFCPFMRLIKGDKYITGVQSGTIKPPDIQPDYKLKSGQRKESNLFDHPAVLSIMEMGYSKTILTKAITIYRKRHGTDLKAEKLLPIVWEIQENNMDVITDEEIFEIEQTKDNETETRCESKSDITELVTAAESTTKGNQ
ncbi:inhibitor of apoptosis protein-like [Mizuhopecten yessoensis]|uniref:inhibitor of apoptosis protein-like n=1 Tax=Mizuhopecten yessoensis TaxID=6573 RepID=UPI000B457F6E|nr:inhibitor of apoptosis protein-like [Mizuhopecten yessoensis]